MDFTVSSDPAKCRQLLCTAAVCPQVSAFQKTKEAFGGIDIVCNNAGLGDESRWHKMLDVNLVGNHSGVG